MPPAVLARFQQYSLDDIGLSSVVAAELAFGVEKSSRPNSKEQLMLFLSGLQVLPWTEAAIWHYARQRRLLKEAGTPIGDMDLLIASHALAQGLVLVTNNTREFERIEGLKLENWVG